MLLIELDGNRNEEIDYEKIGEIALNNGAIDLSPLLEELFRTVVSLGGMISGEHGIGLAKKRYLHLSLDSYQIELMKRIKRTFDPNNILNPGKIF